MGVVAAAMLFAFSCGACPVCNSPTGVQVRRGIFNEQFWRNTALTLAPIPIFAGGVAWIFLGGTKAKRSEHERER